VTRYSEVVVNVALSPVTATDPPLPGFWRHASAQEGKDIMEYELTPERVMEIGKGFEDAFLACLPIDKRLKGLKPEDVLARFKPEDIFARFKPQERIAGLKLEDILANSSAEDIMAYIKKREKRVRGKKLR